MSHRRADRLRRLTAVAVATAILPVLVLTSCPDQRDGTPGQLAGVKDDTQSAARAANLALQLWSAGRSTTQIARVQLGDARDQVVTGYETVAALPADDAIDLNRQRTLLTAMSSLIADLNTADMVLRGALTIPQIPVLRMRITETTTILDREYR